MESFICEFLLLPASRNIVRLLVRAACGCEPKDVSVTEFMMVCYGTDGLKNQLVR